jgi:hypothetical protein
MIDKVQQFPPPLAVSPQNPTFRYPLKIFFFKKKLSGNRNPEKLGLLVLISIPNFPIPPLSSEEDQMPLTF